MMTLKDGYAKFGGDYESVLSRLRKEKTVQKFVFKFLNDQSFETFEAMMKEENYDEALRAVHTLKGICQNLSFDRLFESSNAVTQALKAGDTEKARALMPKLAEDYQLLIKVVLECKQTMEE
ncbi:MAG: Hpt domain-containing protein [Allobaculum sp.]